MKAGKSILYVIRQISFCLIWAWVGFSSTFSFAQDEVHCEEVWLNLKAEDIGSIELPSMICGREVYLSISRLFDFLKIKNLYDNELGELHGYIYNSKDKYLISEQELKIEYQDSIYNLRPDAIKSSGNGLFLKADYFEDIFGLENEFIFSRLSINLKASAELPIVRVAKREQLRKNLQQLKQEFIADTVIKRDHSFFKFGNGAWAVQNIENSESQDFRRFDLALRGEFLGGDLVADLSYNNRNHLDSRAQFYKWRYVNNSGKLFKQVSAGKVNPGSISTLFDPLIGVQITNRSSFSRKEFGTYLLSDITQPDWMVELYLNEQLIDYKRADNAGRYTFNVPLLYGNNKIEIRLYGPWGEEEIINKNINIPYKLLSKGKFEYSLTGGYLEKRNKSFYSQLKMDYGLSRQLSIGGGLEYLSTLNKNRFMPFVHSSVNLRSRFFLNGEYIYGLGFRGNFNYTSPSSLRLDFNYSRYNKDQDALRFRYREEIQARLALPVKTKFFKGTSRLSYLQYDYPNYTLKRSQLTFSGIAFGRNFNLNTQAFFTDFADPIATSDLSSIIKFSDKLFAIPRLGFSYSTMSLNYLRSEFKMNLFEKANINFTYDYDFNYEQHNVQLGFRYNLDFARFGGVANYNKYNTSFSQYISGGFEPGQNDKFIQFSEDKLPGRGSLSFLAFLDLNANGKKDASEPVVPELQVKSHSGGVRKKSSDGQYSFTQLTPHMPHYFELNSSYFPNISWRLKDKSLSIEVTPNTTTVVEVPIEVVGEIGGFIYRDEKTVKIPVSGIKLNIYDENNELVGQCLSQSDGYFHFLGLSSGAFSLKMDPDQSKRIGMTMTPVLFDIQNDIDGDIVDGFELFVTSN
ncbi:hypothetical protein [Christiangramia salexigens]|uniref:SD-repeat containing protein B domain-containing protein n=1 Tax=Christiangramia salexigens TaxID=1913577 RepID=A0A1L3J5F3_9FLAO|nr:hypothetical protein [Christiangramia salexigens]APG60330.1 hypothetical protein LPB144_07870 [Christiangramia salexigens]